jgi:tetratricopeptide (TPR) repeat protein
MKKSIFLVAAFVLSMSIFAQKDEIKVAETALKENRYSEAITALKAGEPLLANAKEKLKAHYYLVLGKAYYANGTNPGNFSVAAQALNKVLEIEKNGTKTYTDEAGKILNALIQTVGEQASKDYADGAGFSKDESTHGLSVEKFLQSAKGFEQVYNLSVRDTAFLQNAAYIYYFAEDYNQSIASYQKLLNMGYTGAETIYSATSALNDQEMFFNSKKEMDDKVRLKVAINPVVKAKEPQTIEMKKMIVKNYIALKQNDKALEAITEAKQSAPNDYGLLVDEANVYYAMGDNKKFKEKLEEAVQINPTDYILHYNIGVMKSDLKDLDGAIDSYNKAIALKPDYADAYNNIGAAMLSKAEPIVEEMNQNLNNFAKYDELQAKQMDVYKEALPFFEKAYELNNSNINVVQALVGIYEQLGMYDKSKELKVVYTKLKG